ncbi:MAG: phosphoenolpyruvate carboxykinase [Peptoniphilaceae bacterium]|nr:phosphoenolpyruvate carboxykinase [Peptoniphilaceae bacterium]MDY6019744.1 phosphoenolpyruvate carboxykinase [Anaerococcus sp.]
MSKEFSITGNKVIMNLSQQYYDTSADLLNSDGLVKVIRAYIDSNKKQSSHIYTYLEKFFRNSDVDVLTGQLCDIIKFLNIMNIDDISSKINKYHYLNKERKQLLQIIEELYDFWRRLERYTIVEQKADAQGIEVVNFLGANNFLKTLILDTYRRVEFALTGEYPKVYRQVQAGANAGLVVKKYNYKLPDQYKLVNNIPIITKIMVETPYITYTKSNKRDGIFKEVKENPFDGVKIKPEHFYCYPAKVGDNLIYIYFHRDLLTHGIATSNLFELANEEEIKNRKPDAIYLFGAKDGLEEKHVFYIDEKNDLLVGYVNYDDKVDYFGYLKKMCLTLNNVINIRRGYLPIHGAGVNIVLQNGKAANIVILGDSGAGKSESIEAFRSLAKDYIREMTVIFDDMGSFRIENNQVMAYGTEIGAFVRLDDLDSGYAFKQIDRSVFMNPDKVNARLIMPVSTYDQIMKGYKVDFFLYADNYSVVLENENSYNVLDNKEDALRIFKRGARLAKGTTTETGLVQTYFANPFGPVQKKEECDILLEKYFDKLFENKVNIGSLRTQLAIQGMEFEGPRNAAIELFKKIKEL